MRGADQPSQKAGVALSCLHCLPEPDDEISLLVLRKCIRTLEGQCNDPMSISASAFAAACDQGILQGIYPVGAKKMSNGSLFKKWVRSLITVNLLSAFPKPHFYP